MCGFNIVGVTLVFAEALRPQDPYVQPRSRKIRSKIGIGIPRSQSKMYPVAPASFILLVKRILDTFASSYRLGRSSCAQEPALINQNAQSGRRMIV